MKKRAGVAPRLTQRVKQAQGGSSKGKRRQNNTASGASRHDYIAMVDRPMLNRVLVPYPDGSQLPSIAYKHRQIYTLRPCADGSLTFSMIPGADGALAVNTAVGFTATLPAIAGATDVITGLTTRTNNPAASLNVDYMVLPYGECATSGNYSKRGFVPYGASQFRVLAQEMKATFTGTSLSDSGAVLTDRRSIRPSYDASLTFSSNGVTGVYDVATPTALTSGSSSTSGSMLLRAARDGFTARVVNTNPLFHDVLSDRGLIGATSPTPVWSSGCAVWNNAGGIFSYPFYHGIDSSSGTVFCQFSGMAPTATITVEVATIIEWVIQPGSPVSGLAVPNPPRNSFVQDYIQRMYAYLPSAETIADATIRFGGAALSALTGIRPRQQMIEM